MQFVDISTECFKLVSYFTGEGLVGPTYLRLMTFYGRYRFDKTVHGI